MRSHSAFLSLVVASLAVPAPLAAQQQAAAPDAVMADATDYQCFVLLASGVRNLANTQKSQALTDQQKQLQNETIKGLHFFAGRISTTPLPQRRAGLKAASDKFIAEGQQTPRPSPAALLRTCGARTSAAFHSFDQTSTPAKAPTPPAK